METYSRKTDKIIKPILAFIFTAVFAVVATSQVVPEPKAVDVDVATINVSFGPQTRAAAQYLGDCIAANNTDDALSDTKKMLEAAGVTGSLIYSGNVGSMLGYAPGFNADVSSSGAVANNAGNVTVYDVDMLLKLDKATGITGSFSGYAAYGYYLSAVGLDETSINAQAEGMRSMAGTAMSGVYLLSMVINVFYNLVFTLLSYANPFTLFSNAIGDSGQVLMGTYNTGAGSTIYTALQELRDWVTELYDTSKGIAMGLVLPLSLALSLATWTLLRKGNNFGNSFKGYFVRLVFACIGVPLMFACYSTVLALMTDFTSYDNAIGNKIVFSTFVDFESWVRKNQLNPTDVADSSSSALDNAALDSVRESCWEVNRIGHPGVVVLVDSPTLTSTAEFHDSILSIDDENRSGLSDYYTTVQAAMDMLTRYGNGKKITAGDFESMRQQELIKCYGMSDNKLAVLMSLSSDKTGWSRDTVIDFRKKLGTKTVTMSKSDVQGLVDGRFSAGLSGNPYTDGFLKGSVGTRLYDSSKISSNLNMGDKFSFSMASSGEDLNGLSTLAMYNYLNSDFSSGVVRVYSPESASDQVKCEHFSVTTIGTGLMKYVYFLDALVFLASVVIIGYSYGLSMMLANFKAIVKMIPQVMTGMLGSMRGIAGAFILTAAAVVEVVGTCIVYVIVNDFMYGLYSIIDTPVRTMVNSELSAFSELALPLIGIVTIATAIVITKEALKWRYAVVQASSEAAASYINKLLGTHVAAPNLSTPASTTSQKLLNAASIGAGLAMGAEGLAIDGSGKTLGESLGLSSSEESTEGGSESYAGMSDAERRAKQQEEALGVKHSAEAEEQAAREAEQQAGENDTNQNSSESETNADKSNTDANDSNTDSDTTAEINAEKTEENNEDVDVDVENALPSAEMDAERGKTDKAAENYVENNTEEFENMINGESDADSESGSDDDVKSVLVGEKAGSRTLDQYQDENGNTVTEYENADGTTTTVVDGEDENGNATRSYDNPDGTNTKIVTDENGNSMIMTTDEKGNVSYAYAGDGVTAASQVQESTVTNSDGSKTTTSYDPKTGATTVSTTDPVTGKTTVETTSATGDTSTKVLSADGQVISVDGKAVQSANAPIASRSGDAVVPFAPTGNNQYSIYNQNGTPYTAADASAGKSYMIADASGKPLVDSKTGEAYVNMNASTLKMDNGGHVIGISNPSTGSFTPANSVAGGINAVVIPGNPNAPAPNTPAPNTPASNGPGMVQPVVIPGNSNMPAPNMPAPNTPAPNIPASNGPGMVQPVVIPGNSNMPAPNIPASNTPAPNGPGNTPASQNVTILNNGSTPSSAGVTVIPSMYGQAGQQGGTYGDAGREAFGLGAIPQDTQVNITEAVNITQAVGSTVAAASPAAAAAINQASTIIQNVSSNTNLSENVVLGGDGGDYGSEAAIINDNSYISNYSPESTNNPTAPVAPEKDKPDDENESEGGGVIRNVYDQLRANRGMYAKNSGKHSGSGSGGRRPAPNNPRPGQNRPKK